MCSGKFITPEEFDSSLANGSSSHEVTQVALGTDSGAIYIFHNYEVSNILFILALMILY